jgi:hypothetical protein
MENELTPKPPYGKIFSKIVAIKKYCFIFAAVIDVL